ncbi:MAG: hypothetical protein ACRBCI_10395 [Cellvibrionaceae bacterium]
MKKVLFTSILLISSCSEYNLDIEEFTFRKLVESDLKEECGNNEACKTAVSDQIKHCMEAANWQAILGNEEDAELMQNFVEKFYPCFKDSNGERLF